MPTREVSIARLYQDAEIWTTSELLSGFSTPKPGFTRQFWRFTLSWRAEIMTPDRVRAWLSSIRQQFGQAHQVVGGRDEGEHPADALGATVAGLA